MTTTNAASLRPGDVIDLGRPYLVLAVDSDGTRTAVATAPYGSPVLPTNVAAHVWHVTDRVALARFLRA